MRGRGWEIPETDRQVGRPKQTDRERKRDREHERKKMKGRE